MGGVKPRAMVGEPHMGQGGLLTKVKKLVLNHLQSSAAIVAIGEGSHDLLQKRFDDTVLISPFGFFSVAQTGCLALEEVALIFGVLVDSFERYVT